MVLKESFTYQNVLTRFVDKAYMYLSNKDNITIKKQTHLKSKSYKDGEDEDLVVNEKKGEVVIENNTMIAFIEKLMEEKIALVEAIASAKRTASEDFDALIESNKVRQRVSSVFKSMSALQSSEREFEGSAYAWNQEGNQTPYRYPIKEVTTIDFDRNETKKHFKAITSAADETSTKIDNLMASLVVEFTPTFDVHDTFEDAYEKFAISINKDVVVE